MQLCWVLLGCSVALGLIGLFGALRLAIEARACGQPSGSWAAAFGLEVGPLTLSGVAGSGAALRVELHALGRRFALPGRKKKARAGRAEAVPPVARPTAGARIWRWLQQPSSGLEPLRTVARHVSCERLTIESTYGFRDIALTGKVAGALYALAGILPPSVVLAHSPSWNGEERWDLTVAGRVAVVPGLVLPALLWYMLRTRLGRTRSAPATPRPA